MILEIALGIVLAVVILALLPYIIVFGLVALVAALAIGALVLVWAFASSATWSQDDLAALGIFAGIAVAVIGLVKAGGFVEKHTQKRFREGEFILIAVLGPIAAYLMVLVCQDLMDPMERAYLFPHLFGFASVSLPLGVVGWRVRQRYK